MDCKAGVLAWSEHAVNILTLIKGCGLHELWRIAHRSTLLGFSDLRGRAHGRKATYRLLILVIDQEDRRPPVRYVPWNRPFRNDVTHLLLLLSLNPVEKA
jgi:hypothetical protein